MNVEQIKRVLDAHRIRAFGPDDCACSCSHEWRKHAEHRDHVAEVIAALMPPEVSESIEEAWMSSTGHILQFHPKTWGNGVTFTRVRRTRTTYAAKVTDWTEVAE